MNKIILVGYMGSGKSEIGKFLSKKINLPFYDLDELIEIDEKMSVSKIFSTKGEIYFRKKEHEIFQNKINQKESFVLSLGGGTPCYANNHLLLQNDDVVSIYLKASINTLIERLKRSKSKRPLISNLKNDELNEFIAKHLFDRAFYYNQCKYTINVDNKSPYDIVEEIKKLL